jgi:hypothetical protein
MERALENSFQKENCNTSYNQGTISTTLKKKKKTDKATMKISVSNRPL